MILRKTLALPEADALLFISKGVSRVLSWHRCLHHRSNAVNCAVI